jgi:hypothetical protein
MKHDAQDKTDQAINALLTYPRMEDAARQCRLSRTTLWRMSQDPDFQSRLQEARLRLSEQIVTSLLANNLDAVNTLRSVMLDEQATTSVRVNAAGKLIDFSLRARQQLDIEQRLSAMEFALQNRKQDEPK